MDVSVNGTQKVYAEGPGLMEVSCNKPTSFIVDTAMSPGKDFECSITGRDTMRIFQPATMPCLPYAQFLHRKQS